MNEHGSDLAVPLARVLWIVQLNIFQDLLNNSILLTCLIWFKRSKDTQRGQESGTNFLKLPKKLPRGKSFELLNLFLTFWKFGFGNFRGLSFICSSVSYE